MRPTAIEMVHLKVAGSIRPALRFLHTMANIPRGALGDGLLTVRTSAILPQPDPIELPTTPRRVQHFLAPPGFEILCPLGIMRIGIRFNLDMPLYWRIRFLEQD